MRDLKLVNYDEPFANLLTQGMVLNIAFFLQPGNGTRKFFWEHEVDTELDAHNRIVGAKLKSDGTKLEYELTTMSKSKNNGVDPQALIDQYGADTARLFMMFASPPEQTLEWADSGVEGAHRFLRRLWNFGMRLKEGGGPEIHERLLKTTRFEIHSVLKQANYDMAKHQFNTVASAAMKMLNALDRLAGVDHPDIKEDFSILLRLLSPITPHITHHLWRELGYGEDILAAAWPEPLEAALVQDEIELVIQVNGKLRGNLRVAKDADKATLEQLVLAHDAVQKQLAGGTAKKVVVVPGRLINVVI